MSYYNKIAGQRLHRIEALSDGVFSIAMTLLVFNLKDPVTQATASETELWVGLAAVLPNLLAFFLSFMTVGIFWVGHSTQFNYIEKSDRNLQWISILFLMTVSLLPFSTSILSAHIGSKVALGIYWFNILIMGLMLYIHWNYAFKKQLLSGELKEQLLVNKAVRNRIVWAQSMYAAGAALCFVSVYLSIFVIIAIQLNYAFGIVKRG